MSNNQYNFSLLHPIKRSQIQACLWHKAKYVSFLRLTCHVIYTQYGNLLLQITNPT